MIKVILVDDHHLVLTGIRSILENQLEIEVTAEAASGEQALDLLASGTLADVIVADQGMPGMNGIELAQRVKDEYPGKKVIILSMQEDGLQIVESLNQGADGYLLKNVSLDELVFAIKHVIGGNKYLCAELAVNLVYKKLSSQLPVTTRQDLKLTEREVEVLHLISQGLTNSEIAETLFLSRRTVEGHREHLLQKTEAKNTATLIRFAVQNQLVA